jgi:hypothetical protein
MHPDLIEGLVQARQADIARQYKYRYDVPRVAKRPLSRRFGHLLIRVGLRLTRPEPHARPFRPTLVGDR